MKTFLILAFIFVVVLEVVTRTPKATTEKPQPIQVPTKVEERVNILWEERQASLDAGSAYEQAIAEKAKSLTNGAIFLSGSDALKNLCRVRVTGVTNGIVFHHFIWSSGESGEQREPMGYFLSYMNHE